MSKIEERGKAQRLLEHVQERFFATIDRRPAACCCLRVAHVKPDSGTRSVSCSHASFKAEGTKELIPSEPY